MRLKHLLKTTILTALLIIAGKVGWGQITYTSTATGTWSAMTWSPVGTPGASDNVVIADGHTVTIDQNVTIASLTVGGGASGKLNFDGLLAGKTLTVTGDISVSVGGTLITQSTGSFVNQIYLGGNLINNGIFDMNQSSSSRTTTVNFNKTNGNQTISSTIASTITLSGNTTSGSAVIAVASTAGVIIGVTITGSGIPLGATVASIVANTSITISAPTTATAAGVTLTLSSALTRFRSVVLNKGSIGNQVIASIDVTLFGSVLTLTNGTWVQNAGTLLNTNTSNATITSTTGGFEIRGSANFIMPVSQNFTFSGTMVVETSGVVNIGTGSGTGLLALDGTSAKGTFTSGTINVDRFSATNGASLTFNGANMNITPSGVNATSNAFAINSGSGGTSFTFSTGTITILSPCYTAGTSTGREVQITTNGVVNMSGTATIVLGKGASTTTTTNGYRINSNNANMFNNLTVDIGANTLKSVASTVSVKGILTLTSGTFSVGAQWLDGATTITNTTTTLALYNPIVITSGSLIPAVNSISGEPLSSFKIAGTTSGINIPSNFNLLNNITIDNSNGTSLQGNLTVKGTVTLTNGTINPNGNTLTYGPSVSLVYNGLVAQTTSDVEFPSSVGPDTLTINNSAGVTLHAAKTVSNTLNLINGTFTNGSNLTLGSSAAISRIGGSLTAVPTFGAATNLTYGNGTISITGTLTSGSNQIINTSSTSSYSVGFAISGTGIPANTSVSSVSGNVLTISQNATASGTAVALLVTWPSLIITGFEVPSTSTGLGNLTLNNAAGVTLSSDATVNGVLTFTNGKFDLGASNLTISGSGSIAAGFDATKYFVTSGVGTLKMNTVTAGSATYPIGSSSTSYTPFVSTNNTSSDVLGFRVKNSITNVTLDNEKCVKLEWFANEGVSGGNDGTITFMWNATDQGTLFVPTDVFYGVWDGSSNYITAPVTVNGTGPYTVTVTTPATYPTTPLIFGNAGAFPSSAKSITGFIITGQIGNTVIDEPNKTITFLMPNSTDLSTIQPTITVSTNATVSPLSGATQAFVAGTPVDYTVTAENGTTQIYKVTAKLEAGVTLSNTSKVYNGSAQSVTVTTNPVGLTVDVTYDGSASVPKIVGDYAVVATINETAYVGSATGTFSITKADLSVTGLTASNKVYNATAEATLGGTAAVTALGTDVVTAGGAAAGTFADKNVGTAKAITVTGVTISGADAGNYNLVQQTGLTADITAANLTVTGLTASNKVYDGLTTAVLSGTAAVTALGSDVVTVGGTAAGAFADKNVGTAKAITVTGVTISGADAGNYNLVHQAGLTADITAANLSVTGLTASNKVYDGLTTAVLSGTAAVTALGSDVVTVGGTAAGAFADKNVGTAKAITVTGVTISGTDASNYNLVQQVGLTADITAANLTVTGLTASAKVYDGLTTATLGGTAAVTVLGSDVVTVGGTAAGAFADKNVGTAKAITVTGVTISGADAGNYNLVQQAGLTANITAANLTVTGLTSSNKVYDGLTTATLGGTAAVAALGSDVVTVGGTAAGAFADKNVGTAKAITVTGVTISGTDAGNYNLVQQAGLTADITVRPLGITATAGQSKKFGEADPTFAYTITSGSLVSGDALTGTLSRVAGETVGTYAIQIGTLTAGSNYNISFTSANFTITPGTAVNPNDLNKTKIYSDTKDIYVEMPLIEGSSQLYVFNILGNMVFNTQNLSQGLNKIECNFVSGTYIVKIVSGKKVFTKKVVLRK
ncbi:MAG: YDG domain-containing protein [Tenuifilaceae bacterium]